MNFGNLIKTGKLELWAKYKEDLRREHRLSYLFWECTLNCNFNCKHCGSSAGSGKIFKNELLTDEIKSALKNVSDNYDSKKIMIAITGGEPLLRKDLFEVMGYAKSLGFSWGMVTNGFLLTPEKVRQAKSSGMSTVVVSIDGLGQIHDEFRGVNGAYDRAIEAVKIFGEANFLQDVQITTSVHRKNYSQLEEMYNEFIKLPINSWRLVNIDPIGRAAENKDILLNDDQMRGLINFIQEKRKKTKKINVTYSCAGYLGPKYEGKLRNWMFYCNTGINTGSILANGDIFVCPNVERRKDFIQGNVKKDDFSEVWNNKFKFFRDKNRTSCDNCKKCSDWEYCLGGPFHLWDFDKNSPKICHKNILQ